VPGRFLARHLDVEHIVRDIALDVLHQLLKCLVRFTLVLYERIPLADSPKPDAIPQFVQRREVPYPTCIYDAQHEQALHLAHALCPQLCLSRVVLRARQRDYLIRDFGAIHVFPGSGRVCRGQPDHPIDDVVQTGEIPILLIVARRCLYCPAQFLFENTQNKGLEIGLAQHEPPLLIDHLALLIQDIVVLQKMLAHVKVVPFDTLLSTFDSPVDHGVLQRQVLFNTQLIHDSGHRWSAKADHQIILQ